MGQYSRFKYKLIRPGFLNESLQPIENYNKFACEYIEQWLKDNDFKDQKYNWNYMKLQYGVAENWFRQLNPDQQILEQQKMQEYKHKGNAERVANATKNLGKILYRMHWCEDHNWLEGVEAFKKAAYATIYAENQKDIDAIVNKKQQFEYDVNNADLSKYTPTDRDWEKMIDYMNRKSNPERLASSCKDPNKVVSRFIIANCIGWKAAANAFKEKALDEGFATKAELEAFYRKYMNEGIPEKWAGYIDAQKENLKSGVNTIRAKENQIDLRVQKILDECPNVDSYEYYETPEQWQGWYRSNWVKITTILGNIKYLYCTFGEFRLPSEPRYIAKYRILDYPPTSVEYDECATGSYVNWSTTIRDAKNKILNILNH